MALLTDGKLSTDDHFATTTGGYGPYPLTAKMGVTWGPAGVGNNHSNVWIELIAGTERAGWEAKRGLADLSLLSLAASVNARADAIVAGPA